MKFVVKGQEIQISKQQVRFLKLLYKFRFVNAPELAKVLQLRNDNTYKVLELLKEKGLVSKVYKKEYRIERKPAYYFLSKTGVTTIRKILSVSESVVHALYKHGSDEFITQCQTTLATYNLIKDHLPPGSYIFSRTEINQDSAFPKYRPDLYIRTPSNQEVIIYIMTSKPNFIINKRIDEIITHSEDEGWDGDYPIIAVVVKDSLTQKNILYKTNIKLSSMGMGEDELTVLFTDINTLRSVSKKIWRNSFEPKKPKLLLS